MSAVARPMPDEQPVIRMLRALPPKGLCCFAGSGGLRLVRFKPGEFCEQGRDQRFTLCRHATGQLFGFTFP